ncbi:DUF2336 domain-containing protein [Sphingomonas carotinifaciens]|uniref:DUF2336 domain-containing protein n=1 Tax=Sphingomonas carotinifaciens TaxID=1166323 RepID=UPI0039A3BC67
MSVGKAPFPDAWPDAWDASALSARASRARVLADARLSGATTDLFLDDAARLDDRTRWMLGRSLRANVGAIAQDLRRHAARVLAGRGATALAETLLEARDDVAERLTRAGLLRDPALMDEMIARVRADMLADSLPTAVAGPDAPSLLVRLADAPDGVIAAAARALLAAESRRRTALDEATGRSDLPAELHHRLVWWVAAAVRPGDAPDIDRAIAEAAARSLAAHDEGERPEAAALRLAVAIDARPDELPDLLIEALGDRRLALFMALLAHALNIEIEEARAMVLEPEGDRLWLAARALDLDRPTIAQIALSLSDADARRDIEALADHLDAIVAIPPEAARHALGPIGLPRDFRAAIGAIERAAA